MKRVLYALIPLSIAAVYYYGWRGVVLLFAVNIAGFLTEFLYLKKYFNEPVSSSVFVTNFIFALSLPPTLPVWMAVAGIVFAVLFGKMVFGGFGRNVFNPAMVGRAFLYVTFSHQMTNEWAVPFGGFPGGLAGYIPDAVTSATPFIMFGAGNGVSYFDLFLGMRAGSLGEACIPLILIGGGYLLYKKTASREIVISTIVGMLLLQTIFWLTGLSAESFTPLSALMTGGFLFGAFFIATDPISAPQTAPAKWMYGFAIGILTVLIREFSAWREGFMFAILLANMFGPLMDIIGKKINAAKTKRKQ